MATATVKIGSIFEDEAGEHWECCDIDMSVDWSISVKRDKSLMHLQQYDSDKWISTDGELYRLHK